EIEAFVPSEAKRSLLALAYLIVFGSIVGLAAYVWLLRVTSPARVSTYAFVNPVVAVLLGWAIGGELLTARILTAGLLMVTGVGAIVTGTNARASRSRNAHY
ncbi:MAG: EamA family transporter, partial [Terriglobia bacterium]